MRRCALRWLSPLLIAGLFLLPAAHAQTQGEPGGAVDNSGRVPVLEYLFALLSLGLLLALLCWPSRKRSAERVR
jgi:hypothetical protein